MAKLFYSAIASLDGFINDEHGNFEWAVPADDVHTHVNDFERAIGTYLYGRRIFEVMRFWERDTEPGEDAVSRDYRRIWQSADKVVYSRTLQSVDVDTTRTRLERSFDLAMIRDLKASSARDISIGGAELAGQALAAGLVDELVLYVKPVVVGSGTSWLPRGLRIGLELVDAFRFDSGFVRLHYAIRH